MPEEKKRVCPVCKGIIYLTSDSYWIKRGQRNTYYCPRCLPYKIEQAYRERLSKAHMYNSVDQKRVDKAVKEIIAHGESIGAFRFHEKERGK